MGLLPSPLLPTVPVTVATPNSSLSPAKKADNHRGQQALTEKPISKENKYTINAKNIDTIALFVKVLNNKDGKDKIIKIIQYTCRIIVWVDNKKLLSQFLVTPPQKLGADILHPSKDHKGSISSLIYYLTVIRCAEIIVSNFSMFRKIMRFGNWLEPLHNLCHTNMASYKDSFGNTKHISSLEHMTKHIAHTPAFHDIVELYNSIFDDVYLFYKMGIFGNSRAAKRWGVWSDLQANKAWFVSIIIAGLGSYWQLWDQDEKLKRLKQESKDVTEEQLKANYKDMYLVGQARKITLLNLLKLTCDMIFCSIDVWEFEIDSIVQTGTGVMSALIGYYKVYHKFKLQSMF